MTANTRPRLCLFVLTLLLGLAAAPSPAQNNPAPPAPQPGPAAAPAAPIPAAPAPATKDSFLDLLMKGGPVLVLLGICSVFAFAVMLERFISLRLGKVIPPGFADGLTQVLRKDPADTSGAVGYCELRPTPISNILRDGVVRLPQGYAFVEKAIEDAAAREVDRMKRSLRPLTAVVGLAPLLGLLGTVLGMITAFQVSTTASAGKADMLARGIYEALVNTAAGLAIAIIALVAHQILTGRVDKIIDGIDRSAVAFLEYAINREHPAPAKKVA
jgi:biopolymer transport protein ExbB